MSNLFMQWGLSFLQGLVLPLVAPLVTGIVLFIMGAGRKDSGKAGNSLLRPFLLLEGADRDIVGGPVSFRGLRYLLYPVLTLFAGMQLPDLFGGQFAAGDLFTVAFCLVLALLLRPLGEAGGMTGPGSGNPDLMGTVLAERLLWGLSLFLAVLTRAYRASATMPYDLARHFPGDWLSAALWLGLAGALALAGHGAVRCGARLEEERPSAFLLAGDCLQLTVTLLFLAVFFVPLDLSAGIRFLLMVPVTGFLARLAGASTRSGIWRGDGLLYFAAVALGVSLFAW